MKDVRRANFILYFGYLFPVSDTMVVKCWRAARTSLDNEAIDSLSAAMREAVITKAQTSKQGSPSEAT